MKLSEEWIGRDVIVWPKRGEGFALCVDHPQDGIVPAVSGGNGDSQGQGLVVAPFLKGTLKEASADGIVVSYRMPPSGHRFIMSLNADAVASVTCADPSNPKPSSLIVGL